MTTVFIHGLGQNASSWDQVISSLAEQRNTVCPDLWTLNNGEMTYKNLYRAFSDYCEKVPGKLRLCGLSLGGMIALDYTIKNQSKVQSLTLIGTQFKIPKAMIRFQNMIFRLMPKSSFTEMGMSKMETIKLTTSMMEIDFSMCLGSLYTPTLILCGEKDNANKKASEYMAAKMPNSEKREIANAGHEINTEAPEKLGEILNQFWQKHT